MDNSEVDLSGAGSSPLSRDDSFFSLLSGNSMYVTAPESISSDTSRHKKPEERLLNDGDRRGSVKSNHSTATLGEGEGSESMWSVGSSSISPAELNGNEDEEADEISMNGTPFEVKADVSRICNDIAEAIQPDVRKKAQISLALASRSPETLNQLKKLAISEGGLLSNELRKQAWAILIGISERDIQNFEGHRVPREFENVTIEIQNLVGMDVSRVLKRFPPGLSDPQQDHLQSHLTKLICSVLNKNPEGHYYQGFHDISLTFLLVCISQSAPYLAFLCLNKMVATSLAPFMERTMDSTHDLIHVIFSIIEKEDKALFNKIVRESKCPSAFSLPWVLTWFSHTLPSDNDVFRLYDFILGCTDEVSPPCLIPIFISAALVLRYSSLIKQLREADIATMHQALSHLPTNEESLEEWLRASLKLMKAYKGKEAELMRRAIEIKTLQNDLWNEDSNNNRRRPRTADTENDGVLVSVGKFIFVKHKWYTLAVVVLGAAYLIQSKYGNLLQFQFGNQFRSAVEKYVPSFLKSAFRVVANQFELD